MDKVQELLIKMLKRNDFFKDLQNEELLKFSNLFQLDMAGKGQAIIIEGHIPTHIYILKKGKVIAKKANGLGSIVLGLVKEGEVFGEMSFFYNKPAMASIVSEEDSNFWKIEKNDFNKFLDSNPIIKTKIMNILSEREKNNKKKLGGDLNLTPSTNNIDDIEINL